MIKKIALTAAVLSFAAFSAPAMAADLIIDEEEYLPIVDTGSSFDWEGAYIGGFLGYYPDFGSATIGAELGYNFLPTENFLFGIEGSGLFYLDGSNDHELWVHGKAGFVVDNFAIYGLLGIGEYNFNTALYDIGAGIEFAVSDSITLNAQVFGREEFGDPPTVLHVQTGIRFHF